MRSTLSLGERLTDLRIQKGLKQEEVAEALDLSRSAISKYENIDENNKNTIDHLSLIKFAKFYGVSADYLIGLDDNLTQKSTPISELHFCKKAFNRRSAMKRLPLLAEAKRMSIIPMSIFSQVQFRTKFF